MSPTTAFLSAKPVNTEIYILCDLIISLLRAGKTAFEHLDASPLTTAAVEAKTLHQKEKELTQWIVNQIRNGDEDSARLRVLAGVPGHLERIGDAIETLFSCIKTAVREDALFTDRARNEIDTLFDRTVELMECGRDIFQTRNAVLMRHVEHEGENFQKLATRFADAHEQRLIEGVCMPKSSSIFLGLIDAFREIERHIGRIVRRVKESEAPSGS